MLNQRQYNPVQLKVMIRSLPLIVIIHSPFAVPLERARHRLDTVIIKAMPTHVWLWSLRGCSPHTYACILFCELMLLCHFSWTEHHYGALQSVVCVYLVFLCNWSCINNYSSTCCKGCDFSNCDIYQCYYSFICVNYSYHVCSLNVHRSYLLICIKSYRGMLWWQRRYRWV